MALSYSDIQRQAILTAEDFLQAALRAAKEHNLKPDPVLLAAFMRAASDDYATMVSVKLAEENVK